MARARKGKAQTTHGPAVDVEEPVAGLYALRLRRNAVRSAIKVWHGPPVDPDTGEEMDRAPRWQATANNRPIDLDRVWPVCAKEPISQADYDYLLARVEWAKRHAPKSPDANPHKAADPLTSPILF